MSDWKPIETAPKDGTMVMLAWRHNGKWVSTPGEWCPTWYGDPKGACWLGANLDEEYGVPLQPTRWTHLPEPPPETLDTPPETG
jgi:hypothetical protein